MATLDRIPQHTYLPCLECGKPVDLGDMALTAMTLGINHARGLYIDGVLHNECAANRARWLAEIDAFMNQALSYARRLAF
jgi:hypothetical protein